MKQSIFLICLLFTKGYASCPSRCTCTLTAVLCIEKGLEAIPNLEFLDNSPVILDFSGNKLTFVSSEDFSIDKSYEVKEIYLNNSEIADIEIGAFDEVENLQELYLGENLLSKVSEFLIEQLENMILLDISNNYFNGDMPTVRSHSLEVLAIANAKITNVPTDALAYLPNLKLLLLQQNDMKTITFDVFQSFNPNFFVKLSYNSWECNCDNANVFRLLESRNFIDSSEPYQCLNGTNKLVNFFGKNGAIWDLAKRCNNNLIDDGLEADFASYKDIRAMVDEKRNQLENVTLEEENIASDDLLEDAGRAQTNDDKTVMNNDCWQTLFRNMYSNDNLFAVVIISTVASFLIGFVAGTLFCKIVYTVRYKKLEQSSDSQVKLLVS